MAIDQRNQLFRQDADKFWPNLPVSMQAAALAIEISGYARCDVDSARPPKARKSLLRRKFTMVFMRALKTHPFPPSERRLRDILATRDPPAE